jgi:hypothetical protein
MSARTWIDNLDETDKYGTLAWVIILGLAGIGIAWPVFGWVYATIIAVAWFLFIWALVAYAWLGWLLPDRSAQREARILQIDRAQQVAHFDQTAAQELTPREAQREARRVAESERTRQISEKAFAADLVHRREQNKEIAAFGAQHREQLAHSREQLARELEALAARDPDQANRLRRLRDW